MKILYISRPKPDYLQDTVFSGLVKTLGLSNIVEYPWNVRYHLNTRQYPKNIGHVKGGLIKSLASRLFVKQFDMVVVASCHPGTLEGYLDIIDKIPASVPTVFIDGGDWSDVAGDLSRVGGLDLYKRACRVRPFDYIFKREYLIDRDYPENVHPLSFACNLNVIPTMAETPRYDVSFWAVESHPVRTQVLNLLKGKFDCDSNGTVLNQTFSNYSRKGANYLRELARCRIVLNFRGCGWDTLRYWEVPAVSGFMISQRPGIVIKNNFIDGKEVVFCNDNIDDLIDLCQYYLGNESGRKVIAENARRKLLEHHTDVHRAKEILSVVNGAIQD